MIDDQLPGSGAHPDQGGSGSAGLVGHLWRDDHGKKDEREQPMELPGKEEHMDEHDLPPSDTESATGIICDHSAPDETGATMTCTEPSTRLVTLNVGAEFGGNVPVRQVFRCCAYHAPIHEADPRLVEAIDWAPDKDPVMVASMAGVEPDGPQHPDVDILEPEDQS